VGQVTESVREKGRNRRAAGTGNGRSVSPVKCGRGCIKEGEKEKMGRFLYGVYRPRKSLVGKKGKKRDKLVCNVIIT